MDWLPLGQSVVLEGRKPLALLIGALTVIVVKGWQVSPPFQRHCARRQPSESSLQVLEAQGPIQRSTAPSAPQRGPARKATAAIDPSRATRPPEIVQEAQ